MRTFVKTSNLPESKVGQFFHSKPTYTEFTLAKRKFKRMKAFARFKNQIGCIDVEYVEKLAKVNNGLKYLPVRQDLFDRTVDSKGIEKKTPQKRFVRF